MKYFLLRLKSKIKIIPMIAIVTLLFLCSFLLMSNDLKTSKINLSMYFEDNDSKNNLLLSLIKGTTSTKENIEIELSDNFESSITYLKEGKIDVLIRVPSNFYDSIMNGENKSAEVYFSNSPELIKGSFRALSQSAASMLSDAQTNIYISDNIIDGAQYDRNTRLNKYFLNESLNREDNFRFKEINKDKSLGLTYILLLICSIIVLIKRENNYLSTYAHLKVKGVSLCRINLMEVLSNSVILMIFGIIICIFLNKFMLKNFILLLPKLAIISIFVSSLIEFLRLSFKTSSVLALLLIIIISVLSFGVLIPRALIPRYMLSLSFYMPINLLFLDNIQAYFLYIVYIVVLSLSTNYMIRRSFI